MFYWVKYVIVHHDFKTDRTAEPSTCPASITTPPPRRRRKPQNPWVMPWALQREERECYRILLDELITTDIAGYRTFTRMESEFFHLIEERITPIWGSQPPTSGSHWKSGWNGSYIETLIHRRKLHFTAVPLDGWKNNHLQVFPPGLQSHFERISTGIFDVSHRSWRLEENWRKI